MPGTLSGGERQRVALARALAVEPRLLLLDEPLSALDRGLRERLAGDLRDILRAAGTTALLVTHDQDEAFAVADRMAVMRAGRLVQAGTIAEVWRAPADAETARFLGYAAVLTGRAAERLLAARRPSTRRRRWRCGAPRCEVDPDGPLHGRVGSARLTPGADPARGRRRRGRGGSTPSPGWTRRRARASEVRPAVDAHHGWRGHRRLTAAPTP